MVVSSAFTTSVFFLHPLYQSRVGEVTGNARDLRVIIADTARAINDYIVHKPIAEPICHTEIEEGVRLVARELRVHFGKLLFLLSRPYIRRSCRQTYLEGTARRGQEMRDTIGLTCSFGLSGLIGVFGLSGSFGPRNGINQIDQTDQTDEIDSHGPPFSSVAHGIDRTDPIPDR